MSRAVIAALLLGTAGVVWAGPAWAQDRGTRSAAARGLDAAGKRALEAQLARTEGERDAYAAKFGISRRLLRAVAQEVGLANPNYTDRQLMTAVEAMADRAVKLQADNARMREEIARLSDPVLRDPALAMLAEAETALEEGRLADAEAVYGRLRELRWDESRAAEEAWLAAVRAQASTAELRGDFNEATRARDEGAAAFRAKQIASQRNALKMEDEAALGRFREGQIFGRAGALADSITRWQKMAIQRDQFPDLWVKSQNNLGHAAATAGVRAGGEVGTQLLANSIFILDQAIEYARLNEISDELASLHNNRAMALQALAGFSPENTALEFLKRSENDYNISLDLIDKNEYPMKWAKIRQNMGSNLKAQAEFYETNDKLHLISMSITYFKESIDIFKKENEKLDLSIIRTNLSDAMLIRGDIIGGHDGLEQVDIAIGQAQEAGKEIDATSQPIAWGVNRHALAKAYFIRGAHTEGPERWRFFQLSEHAVLEALESYDPVGTPDYFQSARQLRDSIQAIRRTEKDQQTAPIARD